MTIISYLFNLFAKNGLHGLESIETLFFLLVVFNWEKLLPVNENNKSINLLNNKNAFESNVLTIKKEFTNKLHIFKFNINNVIFELYDEIINIFKEEPKYEFEVLLDKIFPFYYLNENLSVSKEYIKFLNNKSLSKWIWELAKPKVGENGNTILEGNLKINSMINNIECDDKNYFNEKLFGIQSNNLISDINTVQLYMKSKTFTSKNITANDVLINDINFNNKTFDIIFYDFPQGIHNIIHATCCDKIKKFKIRGTKSEPLLLQLIMSSLNKNGKACIIVPDSLLFSNSVQPVETRKYLLENFCVKKIIQIDEQFYNYSKGIKNSILYFENPENKEKTSNIQFSKISLINFSSCEETIKEENICLLNIDKIKQNIYSLYYKNYQTESNNRVIEFISVNDIFIFSNPSEFNVNYNIVSNIIGLTKYYKNDSSIKYLDTNITTNGKLDMKKFTDITNDLETLIYINSDESTNTKSNIFMIKYLENNLRNKFGNFTKGKMNQFNIETIKSFKIPILSDKTQLAVSNYLELTSKMIICNNEKIQMINMMRDCVMKTIPDIESVELNSITELYNDKTNDKTKATKLIGIIKNGLTAGTVYQIGDVSKVSTNSHYLVIKNEEYLFDYVYHWLLYNESKLKELANLTPQANLNIKNLLSFKIPFIEEEKQLEIISYCNEFESQAIRFIQDNNAITDKDILSSVLKLNNI